MGKETRSGFMLERDLIIRHEDHHPLVILQLSGFLAQLEVYKLKTYAENLLSEDKRYMIADLSNLAFLDSAGIGALLQIRNDCVKSGGQMTMVRPQLEPVRWGIENSTIPKTMDCFPDAAAALKAMAIKHCLWSILHQNVPDCAGTIQKLIHQVELMEGRLIEVEIRLGLKNAGNVECGARNAE
jgi:anti-anti-sigma factor